MKGKSVLTSPVFFKVSLILWMNRTKNLNVVRTHDNMMTFLRSLGDKKDLHYFFFCTFSNKASYQAVWHESGFWGAGSSRI